MRMNMNFKLSVTHFRIIFLVANLALAIALPAYAAYSIWSAAPVAKGVEVADPGQFTYMEVPDTGQTGAEILQAVASMVQPQPPAVKPPDDDPGGTGTTTLAPPEPDAVKDGGPLAADWEYTFYMTWGDRALVKLTKKESQDAGAAAAAAAGAAAARRRASGVRRPGQNFNLARRQPGGQKGPVPAAQDVITFQLSPGYREVKNEELSVHFWIDSATKDELIYWTEDPSKMYRLPFVDLNPFIVHQRAIMPTAVEGEEGAEETAIFYNDEKDYSQRREEEYQKVMSGDLKVNEAALLKAGEASGAAGPAAAPAGAAAAGGAGAAGKLRSGAAGAAGKEMSPAEQKKALGQTLQGLESPEAQAKMSKEDKEQLKVLKETLRGKAKPK